MGEVGSRCVKNGRCVWVWEDELGEQMCGEWEVCVGGWHRRCGPAHKKST